MLKDPRIDLGLSGLWYFQGQKYQTYKLAKAAADAYDAANPAAPVPAEAPAPAVFKLEGAEGYADGFYYLSGEAYIGPWESEENATIAAGKGITPESLGGIPAAPADAPADPPAANEPVQASLTDADADRPSIAHPDPNPSLAAVEGEAADIARSEQRAERAAAASPADTKE